MFTKEYFVLRTFAKSRRKKIRSSIVLTFSHILRNVVNFVFQREIISDFTKLSPFFFLFPNNIVARIHFLI